jgi:hypothetical protein
VCRRVTSPARVTFDLWDVGISSLLAPVSALILSDHEQLTVLAINQGPMGELQLYLVPANLFLYMEYCSQRTENLVLEVVDPAGR